jgi:hypothetical protein
VSSGGGESADSSSPWSVPDVIGADLGVGYREMALDEARESEALEWANATIADIADESR